MTIKNYTLIELDGVKEKSILGVLVFGPNCQSSDSTEFNAEHENTSLYPCHIGGSIPTFRDKKYIDISIYIFFCIKFTIYMYIKYVKNSYKGLFFIFPLYNALTAKLDVNALAKKKL